MKNNKGFSLVELIIVIAIMAILVGVMAPQLIKYIEKSKVASDTQLCDTVRNALLISLSDPDVVTDPGSQAAIAAVTNPSAMFPMSYIASTVSGTKFYDSVVDILGFDPFVANPGLIKSTPAATSGSLCFVYVDDTLYVYITHSDRTGNKNDNLLSYTGTNHITGDVIIVPAIIN